MGNNKNLNNQNDARTTHGWYVENRFILGDIIKYNEDKTIYKFDKLCMIKVDNADVLLSYLGDKDYFNHLKIAMNEAYSYIADMNLNGILSAYYVDSSTFIIAGKPCVDKNLFLKIVSKLYNNFQYIKPSDSDIPILVRFAVITNQSNMLEHALEELRDERNAQKPFIISELGKNKIIEVENELKMINIIYWAMQNDAVIPFYQGIYDNNKKCIEKYESLMRIKDEKGNLYSPDTFIEIAKKYHIYTKLSEMMIKRVLMEIEDKNMEVSINLSAYDINSSEFREHIIEMISHRKSDKLLVFEILEDEIFRDMLVLKQFIKSVEKYGVKIAIDDFGSGYSNLLEIARISPHYIKIDGNIISALNESSKNRAIVESIVYLSSKLNTKVIAEHVENNDIQSIIEQFNIEYSQGFYFSKPSPIEAIFMSV